MQHRGEIVEKAIRASGISISEIARRLGLSRKTMYNYFQNRNLDLYIILHIGKLINIDFSQKIPKLKSLPSATAKAKYTFPFSDATLYANEPDTLLKTIESQQREIDVLLTEVELWRNKYIALLEKRV